MNTRETIFLRQNPYDAKVNEYWTYQPPTFHALNIATGELRSEVHTSDVNIHAGEALPTSIRVEQFSVDPNQVNLRTLGDYALRAHGE